MPKLSEVTGGTPQRMKLSQVAPGADFSGVTTSVDSSGYVEPEIYDTRGSRIPSLGEVNAQNRAYQSSPQRAIDQAKYDAGQLRQKTAEFRELPAPLRALMGAGSRIPAAAMGAGQLLGVTDNTDAARQREEMRFMEGDTAASAGKLTGDAALMWTPGGWAAKLPTVGARVGGGTLVGAGYGALSPVIEGESRGVNTAIGGVAGGGGQVLGEGVRALGHAVTPQARALFDAAKNRGISLTPAQITNSPLVKRVALMTRNLPGSGSAATAEKQAADYTRAVSRTIGEDTDLVTPEVFASAQQRMGQVFDGLAERNTLTVDKALMDRLRDIRREASDVGDDGTIRAVNSTIDRLMTQQQSGKLPGAAYKSLDSQLGRLMQPGGEKAHFLGQVREAIRDGMDSSISQADREAWALVRRQYRDLKTIEPLVAKSETGAIPPAQIMGRVTADKAGKAQMAKGSRGELGDLARIGQGMRQPSSSGTAENLLAGGVLNPVNWPGLALGSIPGLTAGRALNSGALAQIMASPKTPEASKALARLAALGGLGAGPVAADELNRRRGK